jgi:hypothetical protein
MNDDALQAVRMTAKAADAESLAPHFQAVGRPRPGPDEALIRVASAGVKPSDCALHRRQRHRHRGAHAVRKAGALAGHAVDHRQPAWRRRHARCSPGDWCFAPLISALPLIKDGKLQALAVGTAWRGPVLPGSPAITETPGLRAAASQFWVGLFVAARTPPAIVERLHAETVEVLALTEVKDRLEQLGAAPMPMRQQAFETFLDKETLAATKLVKASGIKVE